MSKRDTIILIEDILLSINKIENYICNIQSYEEFIKNDIVVDAVLRNLEVLGEAANKISLELKNKYTEIPWKRVIGLRNIVIHGYFIVDLSIIWKIINEQSPALKTQIITIKHDHI
ncbi:MAG TPA: DUF86 domain-containing protein [Spirochaetota bacterium]|nr:DUF86 domain-containing protein [Spirochaetota bacterium]